MNVATSGPPTLPLTRSSVQAAHEAIKSRIHRTPIFTSSSLSSLLPGQNPLYFKAENLQKGGAFKYRGATYSLTQLPEEAQHRGVCTHSSGEILTPSCHGCICFIAKPNVPCTGNHAGALALAARERSIKCYVVMVCDICLHTAL